MPAYAIKVTEENIRGIILSEAGRDFDVNIALDWLKQNEAGWFVRDNCSPFDCEFISDDIFKEFYMFTHNDHTSILRHIKPA
jgi:hypothetical protein